MQVEAGRDHGQGAGRGPGNDHDPKWSACLLAAPVVRGEQGHPDRAEVLYAGQVNYDRRGRGAGRDGRRQVVVQLRPGGHVDLPAQPQQHRTTQAFLFHREQLLGVRPGWGGLGRQAVNDFVEVLPDGRRGAGVAADRAHQAFGQLAQLNVGVL